MTSGSWPRTAVCQRGRRTTCVDQTWIGTPCSPAASGRSRRPGERGYPNPDGPCRRSDLRAGRAGRPEHVPNAFLVAGRLGRPAGGAGSTPTRVVLEVRAEQREPGRGRRPAWRIPGRPPDRGRHKVDKIDLVDPQVVALEVVGGEVGRNADASTTTGKVIQVSSSRLTTFLRNQVVERADDDDVEEDEQGHPAEGDDGDVIERLEAVLKVVTELVGLCVPGVVLGLRRLVFRSNAERPHNWRQNASRPLQPVKGATSRSNAVRITRPIPAGACTASGLSSALPSLSGLRISTSTRRMGRLASCSLATSILFPGTPLTNGCSPLRASRADDSTVSSRSQRTDSAGNISQSSSSSCLRSSAQSWRCLLPPVEMISRPPRRTHSVRACFRPWASPSSLSTNSFWLVVRMSRSTP